MGNSVRLIMALKQSEARFRAGAGPALRSFSDGGGSGAGGRGSGTRGEIIGWGRFPGPWPLTPDRPSVSNYRTPKCTKYGKCQQLPNTPLPSGNAKFYRTSAG